MKNEKPARCPGCGKHCPLSAPRCKYGRAYAAKKNMAETREKSCPHQMNCKHKWEKHVTRDQPLWQLLTVSRRMKKRLCHKQLSEAELMAALTPLQQEQLCEILHQLQGALEEKR